MTYQFNAFGRRKAITETITTVNNPFTYRGYYYDQDIYGRTLDSMLIEWDAHNDLHFWLKHERVAHTDFDKNDEGVSYLGFWIRAFGEGVKL